MKKGRNTNFLSTGGMGSIPRLKLKKRTRDLRRSLGLNLNASPDCQTSAKVLQIYQARKPTGLTVGVCQFSSISEISHGSDAVYVGPAFFMLSESPYP